MIIVVPQKKAMKTTTESCSIAPSCHDDPTPMKDEDGKENFPQGNDMSVGY